VTPELKTVFPALSKLSPVLQLLIWFKKSTTDRRRRNQKRDPTAVFSWSAFCLLWKFVDVIYDNVNSMINRQTKGTKKPMCGHSHS